MSRRARVLGQAAADVTAFDWTVDRAAVNAAPVPAFPVPAFPVSAFSGTGPAPRPVAASAPVPAAPSSANQDAVAPAAAPISEDVLMAEHRERLAALEREAFTKGYAQ